MGVKQSHQTVNATWTGTSGRIKRTERRSEWHPSTSALHGVQLNYPISLESSSMHLPTLATAGTERNLWTLCARHNVRKNHSNQRWLDICPRPCDHCVRKVIDTVISLLSPEYTFEWLLILSNNIYFIHVVEYIFTTSKCAQAKEGCALCCTVY